MKKEKKMEEKGSAEETFLEEKMKAIEEAEEKEVGKPKMAIFGLILAFAILCLCHFGPTLPGLRPTSQSVLGVFLWFITIMVTDALPKAIVGFSAPLLVVLFAGIKPGVAFKAFSTDIFFLAGGAFVIAGIMMGTPLGKRIAMTIVTKMKSSKVTRIQTGLGLADVAVGSVLPTVSETALFLPVTKAIGTLMNGKEHLPEVKRINTALLLQTPGLTPLFTGVCILTSHFPNVILAGQLESEGIYISWMKWFWLNLPLWGLLPIMFWYVFTYFKLWKLEIPGAREELPKLAKELGKISPGEVWAVVCILTGLVLWMTEGLHHIKSGMVALITAALLFMPWGKIDFKKVNQHIMWDTWVLLGGAISLGTILYDVGTVAWLSNIIVEPIRGLGLPTLLMMGVLAVALQIARAGIVSAVAMGTAFIPLLVGMAKTLNLNILPFSLVLTNCLSYAFFLPISITAFLIAWGASGASGWTAVRFGTGLSVIANIYVLVVQTAWLSLIGYPL
ncbi:MAG: SLC13 family permease [Nitrospirae bacterium]|nr:SLC13 family permease [Nitrospirota bacterium]